MEICYNYWATSQYYIDAAYCYRQCSTGCLSVCLSVGLSQSWALQKWLKRLRCRLGCELRWTKRTIVLDGSPDFPSEWTILREEGGPLQSVGTLYNKLRKKAGPIMKCCSAQGSMIWRCTVAPPGEYDWTVHMCGSDAAFYQTTLTTC